MNFLACDLGGTKVLIAIYEEVGKHSSPKLIAKERYLSAEWDSIYEITKDFLEKKCKNKFFPKIACFGIAGPIEKNNAIITNLNWEVSELKLRNYFHFEKVELINDFAVLIYGIPYLKRNQFNIWVEFRADGFLMKLKPDVPIEEELVRFNTGLYKKVTRKIFKIAVSCAHEQFKRFPRLGSEK